MSSIRVFNAALSTYNKSRQDYQATQAAKEKSKREQEMFDLKKKKAQIELEEARQTGKISDLNFKIYKSQADEYFKEQKKIMEGKSAQVNIAEENSMQGMKKSEQVAKNIFESDPILQEYFLGPAMSAGFSGQQAQPQQPIEGTIRTKPELKGGRYSFSKNFDDALMQAESGEIDYETVRRNFPTKAKQIKEAQLTSLDGNTQQVINDISQMVKEAGEGDDQQRTSTTRINELKDRLFEIVENEEEAKAAGIDTNAIYNFFDISRDELVNALEDGDEDNKGILDKIKKFYIKYYVSPVRNLL